MALLTAEECRAHCNVFGTAQDGVLLSMLASAEDAAAAYLNRSVFESQTAMDAAMDAIPDAAALAQADYFAAMDAAKAETDCAKREAMIAVAGVKFDAARRSGVWALNGIVANGSILAAVKLTLGHLYENREAVVAGASVAELPFGTTALLRPYRRVMMP